MNTFGKIIKDERIARGLLLRQVSALVDIDQGIISKLERGERKPSRKQIENFAEIFGLNIDELIVHWLSDRIVEELQNEKNSVRVLKIAEVKLAALKK